MQISTNLDLIFRRERNVCQCYDNHDHMHYQKKRKRNSHFYIDMQALRSYDMCKNEWASKLSHSRVCFKQAKQFQHLN